MQSFRAGIQVVITDVEGVEFAQNRRDLWCFHSSRLNLHSWQTISLFFAPLIMQCVDIELMFA